MKILSLIVTIGLVASSNGNREFFINIGVIKKLLISEVDLIDTLLDEIAQQLYLKAIRYKLLSTKCFLF